MWGTELRLARQQMREERKNDILGTARQGGYYDVDEMLAHVGPAATYSTDRVTTCWVIGVGLVRMGIPVEKVAAAYHLDPEALGSWNINQVIMGETERAQLEAEIVKMIPETPEPQRYVTAAPRVGELVTDQGTGRPSPASVSPMGSTHFKGAS